MQSMSPDQFQTFSAVPSGCSVVRVSLSLWVLGSKCVTELDSAAPFGGRGSIRRYNEGFYNFSDISPNFLKK